MRASSLVPAAVALPGIQPSDCWEKVQGRALTLYEHGKPTQTIAERFWSLRKVQECALFQLAASFDFFNWTESNDSVVGQVTCQAIVQGRLKQ